MEIIESVAEMQKRADKLRMEGKKIGFVPTMGFLHEGHLSLLRIAKQHCDELVLSIFVNPAQFGPNEDFDSYPRDLERDLGLARQEGVDCVFVPTDETLYQKNYQSYVELEKLPAHLCGLSRPLFFRGVATVVTQLFNIVKPHVAVFGEKDFQQLAIIRQMVEDLKFDIEVLAGPIVREADGLAMSSRNAYLKPEQREAALSLFKVLAQSQEMVEAGTVESAALVDNARQVFSRYSDIEVDYISVCDPETLDEVVEVRGRTLMALAVNLKGIRLIDNKVLAA